MPILKILNVVLYWLSHFYLPCSSSSKSLQKETNPSSFPITNTWIFRLTIAFVTRSACGSSMNINLAFVSLTLNDMSSAMFIGSNNCTWYNAHYWQFCCIKPILPGNRSRVKLAQHPPAFHTAKYTSASWMWLDATNKTVSPTHSPLLNFA